MAGSNSPNAKTTRISQPKIRHLIGSLEDLRKYVCIIHQPASLACRFLSIHETASTTPLPSFEQHSESYTSNDWYTPADTKSSELVTSVVRYLADLVDRHLSIRFSDWCPLLVFDSCRGYPWPNMIKLGHSAIVITSDFEVLEPLKLKMFKICN